MLNYKVITDVVYVSTLSFSELSLCVLKLFVFTSFAQENVKSGWLWKQGGIVKSWHRRYFVMKGDYIYYYSSDDDCVGGKPPLGAIFLPGNRVVDVPFSSSDAEKFQFEIQTGLFLLQIWLYSKAFQ